MKNQTYTSGVVLLFITIFAATNLLSIEARSVSNKGTKATLTINSFEKGGSGGGPSECDGQYHSNDTPIVALSTRWYDNGKRCMDYIAINANGRSVKAMVVDECDSTRGCKNDIVDASRAVWKALKVKHSDWGEMEVTWSDA